MYPILNSVYIEYRNANDFIEITFILISVPTEKYEQILHWEWKDSGFIPVSKLKLKSFKIYNKIFFTKAYQFDKRMLVYDNGNA